jgi:hypothetical protein
MLYIYEAHAIGEPNQAAQNEFDGVCYRRPHTMAERVAIAGDFIKRMQWDIPVLLDTLDDTLEGKYHGNPNALYVVEHGVVQFKVPEGTTLQSPALIQWLERRFPAVPPAAKKEASQR